MQIGTNKPTFYQQVLDFGTPRWHTSCIKGVEMNRFLSKLKGLETELFNQIVI